MSKFLTLLEDIEITRAKDVKKHGDHDQSSHGSWAQGIQVAPEIVRSTLERVKENGGLSVNLKDGTEPTKGFMVAKGRKFGAIVKADDFFNETKGAEILSSYMKQHKSDFNNSNNYLGLWHNTDDGQVYLDVSENILDENQATSRGRERDQISIWDVANFKEIETGGTGGIEKTRSSTTARYVRDDGRADRRLRQRDLGEVSKTLKVIYFDYGLKPVLKHGEHDQSEHGNWATGRSEEDVKRIAEFKNRGPSIANLDETLESSTGEIDRDKARFMIENDSNLNDDVENRISEIISNIEEQDGEPMSEEDKLNNYDDYRNQATEELIDEQPDFLEEYARANEYGSLNEPEGADILKESLDDVYGLERTATFREGERQGEEITMTSAVTEVTLESANTIKVVTNVEDENGNRLNGDEIVRYLTKDEETGTWSVEHSLLKLDREYRGLGFGGKFLQQSEDYYVAKGFTHIKLNAGLEDGARHWANSGFDWNRDELPFIVDTLKGALNSRQRDLDNDLTGFTPESQKIYREELEKGKEILSRMVDTNGNIRDMKEDSFPLPKEFASLGADRPLKDGVGNTTYTGKELLRREYIPYVKFLTAEGQNLIEGPIDMDGDGLVYDGTPREKPVSGVGKK